tara:strand:- start:232 stop:543 length:312 start_codon:yes stop_codon:yes gene_type:complete
MKISDLVIGEFYIIKPTTKKQVMIRGDRLTMGGYSPTYKENLEYKQSLYIYAGQEIEKVTKKVDSKRKEVYTYRPHIMVCIRTGEKFKIAGYYIQTYFIKPKK